MPGIYSEPIKLRYIRSEDGGIIYPVYKNIPDQVYFKKCIPGEFGEDLSRYIVSTDREPGSGPGPVRNHKVRKLSSN